METLSISHYYWEKRCGGRNVMPMIGSLEAQPEQDSCASDLLRESSQEKENEG